MKHFLILLSIFLLAGCSPREQSHAVISTTSPESILETTLPSETDAPVQAPAVTPDPIREMISDMSLQERVGQLFLARCDDTVALADIQNYHLGGFILFGRDFE